MRQSDVDEFQNKKQTKRVTSEWAVEEIKNMTLRLLLNFNQPENVAKFF